MTDAQTAAEVTKLVDLIVERCREDGMLVTINKHYPPAHAWFERGFYFTAGVGFAIFCGTMIGGLVNFIWGLIP